MPDHMADVTRPLVGISDGLLSVWTTAVSACLKHRAVQTFGCLTSSLLSLSALSLSVFEPLGWRGCRLPAADLAAVEAVGCLALAVQKPFQ